MAPPSRRSSTGRRGSRDPLPEDFEEHIVDIDVGEEMRTSFLEYAYSVIYSRALPDARDGLKPVQRRILHTMAEMGLRPDRGHVKSARVVGEVMGRLHPHGDGAIYDALVRMVQPWSLRLPMVDGHGNFGSPDEGPAAMRYTECRLAAAAIPMTASIDEDTVDFKPNYDSRETEPTVLPAAIPNLLVNGAAGIAVGMATNMAPHNLVEVVQALRHLVTHPNADLDALMRFIPGPDLPTGGKIIGLGGIRDAYETGRGTFKMRATVRVENVTPAPQGTRGHRAALRRRARRRSSSASRRSCWPRSSRASPTSRTSPTSPTGSTSSSRSRTASTPRRSSSSSTGSRRWRTPSASTPSPWSTASPARWGSSSSSRSTSPTGTTWCGGVRRTGGPGRPSGCTWSRGCSSRSSTSTRSSSSSAPATTARRPRQRLMSVFDLDDPQATYILDLQLRRLTRFSRIELEKEKDELEQRIAALDEILNDESKLRAVVSDELAEIAKAHGTPRRTVLLQSAGQPSAAALSLEVTDDPCFVFLSSAGLLARSQSDETPGSGEGRSGHDVIVSAVRATARGHVGVVTTAGRVVRLDVVDLPALPPTANAPHLQGGAPLSTFLQLEGDERALALTHADRPGAGPRARHPAGRRQAGQPRAALARRVGGGAAGRRRRGRGGRRADHRRGGALLRHQRRPAAALRRRCGAAAGPQRRRDRRCPAGRRRPGGLLRRLHRRRGGRGRHRLRLEHGAAGHRARARSR